MWSPICDVVELERTERGREMISAWKEHYISLIRTIGSATYGKERWFLQENGLWYDRERGEELTIDELEKTIFEEINEC